MIALSTLKPRFADVCGSGKLENDLTSAGRVHPQTNVSSSIAHPILQRFISRYFGRPNSFNARTDSVPVQGTYLCVACFYVEGHVTAVSLNQGSQFPYCQTCRGTQWSLKGADHTKSCNFGTAKRPIALPDFAQLTVEESNGVLERARFTLKLQFCS